MTLQSKDEHDERRTLGELSRFFAPIEGLHLLVRAHGGW